MIGVSVFVSEDSQNFGRFQKYICVCVCVCLLCVVVMVNTAVG